MMRSLHLIAYLSLVLFLLSPNSYAEQTTGKVIHGNAGSQLFAESFATFNAPWAMTFLPNGGLLVTEKSGTLFLLNLADGSKTPVQGVPNVAYGGQGGLGDVVLHPQYA